MLIFDFAIIMLAIANLCLTRVIFLMSRRVRRLEKITARPYTFGTEVYGGSAHAPAGTFDCSEIVVQTPVTMERMKEEIKKSFYKSGYNDG